MYKSSDLTRCRCLPIHPSEETVVEIPIDLTPYLVMIKNDLFLVLRDPTTDEYLTYTIIAGDTHVFLRLLNIKQKYDN